jgi:choline dehydrogenase-like flavoprotein
MNTEQQCDFDKQHWDVCIIGSGPAGIAVANELKGKIGANGEPIRVLMLESSKEQKSEDPGKEPYDLDADNLNEGQMGTFMADTWSVRHPGGDVPDNYTRWIRLRGFGGTTAARVEWHDFGGWCRPLSATDFTHGWPEPLNKIDEEPLDKVDNIVKFYQSAQDFCSLNKDFVSPEKKFIYDEPDYWIALHGNSIPHIAKLEPRAEDKLKTGIFQIIEKRKNGSSQGNPDGWPDAREFQNIYNFDGSNVKICRGFTAQHFSIDPSQGSITDLIVKNQEDKVEEHRVRAYKYVLAAGCMENTRLLLLTYAKVGKPTGNIGKYFTTHPQYARVAEFNVREDIFTPEVRKFFDQNGLRVEVKDDRRYKFFCCLIPKDYVVSDGKQANFRFILGFQGNRCVAGFAWEQSPNPDSTISLASSKDAFGEQQLICDWRLTPDDWNAAKNAIGHLTDFLAGRIEESDDNFFMKFDSEGEWPSEIKGEKGDPRFGPQPAHEMGSTRMSAKAADGVVDANCRMWDFKNVYIAGSSVFPRVGWANPTLTIIALAIRLGQHLYNELGDPAEFLTDSR